MVTFLGIEESEHIGSAMALFSVSFLFLVLVLWFILNGDGFWAGILAWSGSLILSSIYYQVLYHKSQKHKCEANNKTDSSS